MERDVALAEVAEGQHGLVSRAQAAALGFGPDDVRRLLRLGRWEAITPHVLRRRGAPETWHQRVLAAVLDAGPGSTASHRTAAALWRLPGFPQDLIEITRGGRRHGRHPAIAFQHRPRLVPPQHVTCREGIPVGSVALTIFQLAASGTHPARLGTVVNLVANRSPGTLRSLHDLLDVLAARGRPGIRTMRTVLGERPVGSVLPASGLERRFEEICSNAGLPRFRRQVDVGGHDWVGRVDFVAIGVPLLIEVDSELHHLSPDDRARDAARDAALHAAGFRVLRIPEEWIWHAPWRIIEVIRDALRLLGAEARAS